MSERNIDGVLEESASLIPDKVMDGLIDAVRGGKPALKDYLMSHRGQQYTDELIGCASVMLRIEAYYANVQSQNLKPQIT